LRLAEAFGGEIVSCDSVAIYRGMDIGSAKPSVEDLARVPHHALDLLDPDQPSTAGDYARAARQAITDIAHRGKLPIVAGGTGLYLRALLDGLAPAPQRDEALRERLRSRAVRRGRESLHRMLRRFDSGAARLIHPNDTPKIIRSLEVTLLARRPQTEQWETGRDPLTGFRVLQLGLDPPRAALYERINARAASMFDRGLLDETAGLRARFGDHARALGSLGYAQAAAVLEGRQTLAGAVAEAQQGHRNYAKRQLTWFRRDKRIQWLHAFGDDPLLEAEALTRVREHLMRSEDGRKGSTDDRGSDR
jgi:tRNA dimethylallyltransferase